MCSYSWITASFYNLLWRYLLKHELSIAKCYSLVDDLTHGSFSEAVDYIDLQWDYINESQFSVIFVP